MLTKRILELNYSINTVDAVAKQLLEHVSSKIILFSGDMGVGKTTLIKAIVKALGSQDDVQSPTYSIVNEYRQSNTVIYHFDLYRIETIEEAYNFGIEEYLDSDNWCFIEWPNIIEDILPENVNRLFIELNDDKTRQIKLK